MSDINIYENLEIKDYESFDGFFTDIMNRISSMNKHEAIILFGDCDFIYCVLLQLYSKKQIPYCDGRMPRLNYDISYIYLNNIVKPENKADRLYYLEINGDKKLLIDKVYNEQPYNDVRLNSGQYQYTQCFINQDYAVQSIVDYSLINMDETVLFGFL